MARFKKTFLATVIISSMTLTSSIEPSLSHGGHNNSSGTEKTQKLSEEQNNIDRKIEKKSSPSNEIPEKIDLKNKTFNLNNTQVSPHSKELVKSTSALSYTKFNLIPQLTELVFFLLIVSPYLLYIIRNKINKKETNS